MRKHLFPVLLLANTLWSCLFAQTPIVMDMVHHNPGEPFTNTWFNEPGNLVQYGFNAQVVNEFQSVHTAITYSSLDPRICPAGSKEHLWIDSVATRIENKIEAIHKAGLEAYYFTDIIVLPKRLVEIYKMKFVTRQDELTSLAPKHKRYTESCFKKYLNVSRNLTVWLFA